MPACPVQAQPVPTHSARACQQDRRMQGHCSGADPCAAAQHHSLPVSTAQPCALEGPGPSVSMGQMMGCELAVTCSARHAHLPRYCTAALHQLGACSILTPCSVPARLSQLRPGCCSWDRKTCPGTRPWRSFLWPAMSRCWHWHDAAALGRLGADTRHAQVVEWVSQIGGPCSSLSAPCPALPCRVQNARISS